MRFNRARAMKIGLLGGSFNPAHDGHIYISCLARKYLFLDAVWWIIAPKNPEKPKNIFLAFDKRFQYAKNLTNSISYIKVLDIELSIKNSEQCTETIFLLKKLLCSYSYTDMQFIWLSGADSVMGMHFWREIDWIFQNISIAIFARKDMGHLVINSPIAVRYSMFQYPFWKRGQLWAPKKPAWIFFPIRLHPAESRVIRSRNEFN